MSVLRGPGPIGFNVQTTDQKLAVSDTVQLTFRRRVNLAFRNPNNSK